MSKSTDRNNPDQFRYDLRAYYTRGIIWTQRKIFSRLKNSKLGIVPSDFSSVDESNVAISNLINSDKPCMITRFGSVEMDAFCRYFDMEYGSGVLGILTGKNGPFWPDMSVRKTMNISAGFFPPTDEMLSRFYHLVKEDCQLIDLHASWYPGESRLKEVLYAGAMTCSLGQLEPFFSTKPWTKSLQGKKVLLVHPFSTTIESQYAHRTDLFNDPEFLPQFDLKTYKPVVSHCGEKPEYADWFDALKHMVDDISTIDFDIAIIGAGAYGMSLAAAIKRMGKKAIHMGGVTQLLFGIKGMRWERDYGPGNRYVTELFRDTWCRPNAEETPVGCGQLENKAYW